MGLSTDQQKAADFFMEFMISTDKPEMAIGGPSGSGKSYLTRHLIDSAKKQIKLLKLLTNSNSELSVYYTATTNKAAAVLSDMTGEEAQTIHSLLGLKVFNNFATGKTSLKKTKDTMIVKNSLVIIDEASMIDTDLLAMIRECTFQCKVLYIGDPYQMSPIFETTCPVFNQVSHVIKLSTIQRQVVGSPIIALGDQLRQTQDTEVFPKIESCGTGVIQKVTGPEFKALVDKKFTENPSDNSHARIIAWKNERVHQYNTYVRKLFTTEDVFQPGEFVVTNKPIIFNNRTFLKTDEIGEIISTQVGNEKGVNGYWVKIKGNDGGTVTTFLPKHQYEVKELLKGFKRTKSWPTFFEYQEFFSDLRPIHAITTHKSQGSSYNNVFIDLKDIGSNNQWNEVARLLYVGITRARSNVYLYGDLPARYGG